MSVGFVLCPIQDLADACPLCCQGIAEQAMLNKRLAHVTQRQHSVVAMLHLYHDSKYGKPFLLFFRITHTASMQ